MIPEKKNFSRLPAPSDKGRLVWARYATISANLTLLSAFFVMGLSRYAVLPTIGAGFCVVAAGCLSHLLAEFIRPERNWQRVMILLIVASGFAVFGVVGLLLGLEI